MVKKTAAAPCYVDSQGEAFVRQNLVAADPLKSIGLAIEHC